MASLDLTFEKGLPSSVDTERFVLGMILLNDTYYLQVAGALEPDDFSLEKHRRIFGRMKDLYDRGERIDRVTLADELIRQGQLESVDGLAYLVSLDDGLPERCIEIYRKEPRDGLNSLHADRLAGRPMEVDARNGAIVRLGRKHGIPTPANKMAVMALDILSEKGSEATQSAK